jgi:hypothetical protein
MTGAVGPNEVGISNRSRDERSPTLTACPDSMSVQRTIPPVRFALRFEDLFNSGRALSFPCDAQGSVNIDALSERGRDNYFYARTVVGRVYTVPFLERLHLEAVVSRE